MGREGHVGAGLKGDGFTWAGRPCYGEGTKGACHEGMVVEGFGGLKQLSMGTVEDVEAGRGEVVIRVKYAALNPADRFLSEGQYPARPALPHVLGRDGMGEVVCAVGRGVMSLRMGDRGVVLRSEVGVTRWGTLAEYVAVPAESAVRVPAGWGEEAAAAGPLVYLTAYQALTQWGEIFRGSVVLVTGASGGVGVAAIQLARAMGLRVLGLSRSVGKRKRIKELGAEEAFDPEAKDWVEQVKSHLRGKRVELAVDNVAGEGFEWGDRDVGGGGKVSVVGRSGGVVPEFNTASLFFRRNRIGGVAVGAYTPAESQAAWKEVVRLLSETGGGR